MASWRAPSFFRRIRGLVRKIIITDIETSPGAFLVRAYLWLAVPGKRGFRGQQRTQLPPAGNASTWGVTGDEQDLFTKGVVQEDTATVGPFSTGTDLEVVRAALLIAYGAAQARLDATASGSLDIVGQNWDGAAWSGK